MSGNERQRRAQDERDKHVCTLLGIYFMPSYLYVPHKFRKVKQTIKESRMSVTKDS